MRYWGVGCLFIMVGSADKMLFITSKVNVSKSHSSCRTGSSLMEQEKRRKEWWDLWLDVGFRVGQSTSGSATNMVFSLVGIEIAGENKKWSNLILRKGPERRTTMTRYNWRNHFSCSGLMHSFCVLAVLQYIIAYFPVQSHLQYRSWLATFDEIRHQENHQEKGTSRENT